MSAKNRELPPQGCCRCRFPRRIAERQYECEVSSIQHIKSHANGDERGTKRTFGKDTRNNVEGTAFKITLPDRTGDKNGRLSISATSSARRRSEVKGLRKPSSAKCQASNATIHDGSSENRSLSFRRDCQITSQSTRALKSHRGDIFVRAADG